MVLPVVIYGNPILRSKAVDIPLGSDIKQLVNDMFETTVASSGCGLAAPQIGEAKKIFIVDFSDDEEGNTIKKVFINPEIVSNKGTLIPCPEGCLSLPDLQVTVDRVEDVTITYYDINWKKHVENYQGFVARIIQHEYDHLVGKLIIDYVKANEKTVVEDALNRIKENKIIVDYPILVQNVKT